jgi:long-subunit fatty acid transport protein
MKFKIILIAAVLSIRVFAGGPDFNSLFGAKAASLNGLYYAGSGGLNSILTNPAALILSNGRTIELSVVDRMLQNEFDSESRDMYRSYREDNVSYGGGLLWKLNNNFVIAAAYHPVIDYNVNWPFATQRANDSSSAVFSFTMRNEVHVNSISPAVAFRIDDLVIGLTANIYRVTQQVSFPQANEKWNQAIGLASYQFEYDIDAWAFGGTLGLLYKVNDEIRVGISARSGFTAKLEGDAKSQLFADTDSAASLANVSTELEIPWKFGAGVVYKLNDNIQLNFDASYSLWGSTAEELNYTFDNPVWQNGTSSRDSITGFTAGSFPLNYDNTFEIGVGAEFGTLPGTVLRAGYRYTKSPNSVSTYNFLYPGVDTHALSAGIALQMDNLLLEGTVIYYIGTEREVHKENYTVHNGSYNMNGVVPAVTLTINL